MSDNNPYQTPKAPLETPVSEAPKIHVLWKVFFFFILFIQLFSWYSSFNDLIGEQEDLLASIADLTIYPFLLLGLYGYVYQKCVFNQRFWQVLFPVSLCIELYLIGVALIEVFQEDAGLLGPLIIMIVMLILVPVIYFHFLAIYRYAYNDVFPWQQQQNVT